MNHPAAAAHFERLKEITEKLNAENDKAKMSSDYNSPLNDIASYTATMNFIIDLFENRRRFKIIDTTEQ